MYIHSMESPKVQKRPIKPHGFKCPLHILQCLSWLVISYTIVVSYTLVLPLLERALSIVFAVCLSLSELVMVVLWFLATIVDPTDLMVYGKKEEDASSEYRAFCSMCNCTVSLSSKHCGQCNRCVDNFDHHCKWLNNCIGRRNYCLFIALIITLEVASCVVAAFTSLLLANVALDSEFESRLSDVYSYEHVNGIIILLAVLLVANTCILVANGQLIYLHIWLKMKKMTTYQYLMLRRSKRKVKHGLEQPATEEFADIAQSERQGAESPREEIEQVNNSVRKISPSPEMKTRTMMSKSVTIVPTSHLTEGTGAEEEFPSLGREEESM